MLQPWTVWVKLSEMCHTSRHPPANKSCQVWVLGWNELINELGVMRKAFKSLWIYIHKHWETESTPCLIHWRFLYQEIHLCSDPSLWFTEAPRHGVGICQRVLRLSDVNFMNTEQLSAFDFFPLEGWHWLYPDQSALTAKDLSWSIV